MPSRKENYRYDVCLSFAGPDRTYVKALADTLSLRGVRVFYDEYEKVNLWGKDLYSHLDDIYRNAAHYCVVFLSRHYAERLWTNHERQSAQARAFKEHAEYILPVRFDDTVVPGIRDTIGYIDLRSTSSNELCGLIEQKIGPRPRREYFPPVPDRLFKRVGAKSKRQRALISLIGEEFCEVLKRMNNVECQLLFDIYDHGCPAELPENIHINIDLLRRVSGASISKIKRTLTGISSLGFECTLREANNDQDSHLGEPGEILVLEWHSRSISTGGNYTEIAGEIVDCAREGYCMECGREALLRLDFCQLATPTFDLDGH